MYESIYDYKFGGSEAIITAISDEYPLVKRNREIFVALLFSFYFIVGLASCTQASSKFNLLSVFIIDFCIFFLSGWSVHSAIHGPICSRIFNFICCSL